MDISTQIWIERQYSKRLVSEDLLEVLLCLPEMTQVKARFSAYISMNHNLARTQRLYSLQEHMHDNDITIEDIFVHIMVTLHMTNGEAILQALCGQNMYLTEGDVTMFSEIVMLMNNILYTTERRGAYVIVISKLTMPQGLADRINNVSYVPPMVVKPRPYTSNYDGGYYEHKVSLLTGKNQHGKPQNLDFINTMNNVAMSLDENVLVLPRVAQYSIDTAVKRKHFDKLISDTKRVIGTILDAGNKFYFLYRFDARGRSYASGYQISPMGDDYSKALINLHKKEIIDEDY